MTVGELYFHVSQLGFEVALESNDRFYYAANRALLQVNDLRPAIKSLVIDHKPLRNMLSSSFEPRERFSDVTFEAVGAKAYYCEADGTGMLFIERYDEASGRWEILDTREMSSKAKFVAYKGFFKDGASFAKGRVRLRFSGEFAYSTRNVALYEHIYSADIADIPAYEPYTRYDLKAIAEDFLGFASPPIVDDVEQTRLNQSYEIEGSTLLLPYDKKGVYKVMYKCRPQEIINGGDATVDSARIDLDDELSYLMPNLVAAYIWAEDEPTLAEYYLSLYRERANEIRALAVNASPAIYKNVNGW